MKCKHCGYEIHNPEIFNIHEANCIDEQIQNGLIADPSLKDNEQSENSDGEVDYSSMTVDQLKAICKEKNLEGYSNLNKDDLITFIKENIKG
ncbi:MAG: Rho termination factor [Clostridium beijerinckii]|nr:Rho termination factor [Clostridium beijerinckii]